MRFGVGIARQEGHVLLRNHCKLVKGFDKGADEVSDKDYDEVKEEGDLRGLEPYRRTKAGKH